MIVVFAPAECLGQQDPGVRQGPPGAGRPLPGLTPIELSLFNEGLQRSIQLEAACHDCTDLMQATPIDPQHANFVTTLINASGLRARFNAAQCTVCHNQTAFGARWLSCGRTWMSGRGDCLRQPRLVNLAMAAYLR